MYNIKNDTTWTKAMSAHAHRSVYVTGVTPWIRSVGPKLLVTASTWAKYCCDWLCWAGGRGKYRKRTAACELCSSNMQFTADRKLSDRVPGASLSATTWCCTTESHGTIFMDALILSFLSNSLNVSSSTTQPWSVEFVSTLRKILILAWRHLVDMLSTQAICSRKRLHTSW